MLNNNYSKLTFDRQLNTSGLFLYLQMTVKREWTVLYSQKSKKSYGAKLSRKMAKVEQQKMQQ